MSDPRRRDGYCGRILDVTAFDEHPVVFRCENQLLIGIVAAPPQPHKRGLVVLVGGPQYRAGSHRQFTLLCRHLAGEGIASFRFDYHGLGDSEGPPALGVDGLSSDLRCAIDVFLKEAPQVEEVLLWGLCGAASAAALYAPSDRRVTGIVMLNPWVRTEQGRATAQLRYYYLDRLRDPALWHRLLRGEVEMVKSLRDFANNIFKAAGLRTASPAIPQESTEAADSEHSESLPDRVLDALSRAKVRVLVILSGADLTANEFRQVASGSRRWRRLMASPRVTCREIPEANHTFARADWRQQVAEWTAECVKAA